MEVLANPTRLQGADLNQDTQKDNNDGKLSIGMVMDVNTFGKTWKKGSLLGRGAYGSVHKCIVDTTSGTEFVAVKEVLYLSDSARETEIVKGCEEEIAILRVLSHPNIVQYLGTERFHDLNSQQNTLHIFLEYVSGGSIASLVEQFGPLEQSQIKGFLRDIFLGLEYLHANNIAHRDVKGANILVTGEGRAKLTDFGQSKRDEDQGLQTVRGTPFWMAPEVIRGEGYGRPADIWSVGCTGVEMATGNPPWSNFSNVFTTMYKISHGTDPPDIPEAYPPSGKDFLLACFTRNAKGRPSATDLLKHPYLVM